MRARTSMLLGACGVLGCGTELRPASYIETTEILTVQNEVVQLGPLAPDRVGPKIAGEEMPIAEALPGDRIRLEAIVVDVDGQRLPELELETLWVTCGGGPCNRPSWYIDLTSPEYDRPCELLAPNTTDDMCVLGKGTGAFEFEIPDVGEFVLYGGDSLFPTPRLALFGVVAWNGRPVEECWDIRHGTSVGFLDDCGFIRHDVTLGPFWWIYKLAVEQGYENILLDIDLASIPDAAFLQPANRVPRTPTVQVTVDDKDVAAGVPPLAPILIGPNSTIEVAFEFDPLTQLFQSIFKPLDWDTADTAEIVFERIYSRTATTGAIVSYDEPSPQVNDGSFSYQVDPILEPGISRVLILYFDSRNAFGYLTLEFEHR